MPFSDTKICTADEWTDIYENVFRESIEPLGYKCERAQPATGSLIKSIISKLRTSRIVIADITDRNPNVFYELGVRHTLSNRTVIVSQDEKDIPSDLKGYWSLLYGIKPKEVKKFKEDIKRIITDIELNPDRSDSPVFDYLNSENLIITRTIQIENIKKLNALYTELTGVLLTLKEIAKNPKHSDYLSYCCLELLLSTMYIDVGDILLKEAYEIYHKIKTIDKGIRGKGLVSQTIGLTTGFVKSILEIRKKMLLNEFQEPETITAMKWQSDKVDIEQGKGMKCYMTGKQCAFRTDSLKKL